MVDYQEANRARWEDNRANWDDRVPAHVASPDYAVDRYLTEPGLLSDVVRFDQPLLGDVTGQRGAHLQCHIGTDTISLSRLGATMTGLDFSAPAIEAARKLAEGARSDAVFVESDVYAAAEVLDAGSFDFVYTGVGALCWLPSVRKWAEVVAELLRPAGRLFIRDMHPVLATIEDRVDDLLVVKYPYFEQPEPLTWDQPFTYVETDAAFEHTITHEWNHGLGEIVTALLDAGMRITGLAEHDTVPWNALPGQMEQVEIRGIADSEWRLIDNPQRLPHTFTLQAVKEF